MTSERDTDTPVVVLRDMRQDEYEAFWAQQGVEYIDALAESLTSEAAKRKAREAREQYLPQGLATEGHRLLVAENAGGEAVGRAWIGFREPHSRSPETAWLYDIRVDEHHRRSGYARAILAAVESLAREAGAARLGLNVFGHNKSAISLYETSGYEVTAQQMAKWLR